MVFLILKGVLKISDGGLCAGFAFDGNDVDLPAFQIVFCGVMLGGGKHVLALARRDLPERSGAYTSEAVERNLVFLGLMAMMDPPRPQVEQAVRVCREASIRIVMITGDYGLTAESLARREVHNLSPSA